MIIIEKLAGFIENISEFNEKSSAEQLELFSYFLTKHQGSFTVSDVRECFDKLNIVPYSNINQYLSKHQKEKYLKKAPGKYVLTKKANDFFDSLYENKPKKHLPSNSIFPVEIIEKTRTYIEKIAKESIICYDYGLYNASFVLLRRLIETLIIEIFEKFQVSDRIKNHKGAYFHLESLIEELIKENTLWNIGRNAKKGFSKIKIKGDLAAHNRRFIARKSDIDQIQDEIRVCIEELIHICNF